MSYSPTPSQGSVQAAVRGFLLSILPAGVEVFEGLDNRVGEPTGPDYVVMTPTGRERLGTNVDAWADTSVVGGVSGTVLTVSSLRWGLVLLGSTLWGAGVASGTTILSQSSGPTGGAGTYALSQPSSVSSGTKMACGNLLITQSTLVHVQLDVHSALSTDPTFVNDASDMAQTISTLLRDEVATDYFDTLDVGVSPLHADEPRQADFSDAEQQYEMRYVVDAQIQANQTIQWPTQYAEQVQITIRPAN